MDVVLESTDDSPPRRLVNVFNLPLIDTFDSLSKDPSPKHRPMYYAGQVAYLKQVLGMVRRKCSIMREVLKTTPEEWKRRHCLGKSAVVSFHIVLRQNDCYAVYSIPNLFDIKFDCNGKVPWARYAIDGVESLAAMSLAGEMDLWTVLHSAVDKDDDDDDVLGPCCNETDLELIEWTMEVIEADLHRRYQLSLPFLFDDLVPDSS